MSKPKIHKYYRKFGVAYCEGKEWKYPELFLTNIWKKVTCKKCLQFKPPKPNKGVK